MNLSTDLGNLARVIFMVHVNEETVISRHE